MHVNNSVCKVLDSLISEGKIKDVIFVMVSGVHTTMGSFYVNSPVLGNWQDFVISDVMSYIDDNYRTIAKKESRALVGFSMGGYGVLKLGLSNTHLYNVVYSLSPGLFNKQGLKNSQLFHDSNHVNDIYNIITQYHSVSEEDAQEEYLSYLKSFKRFNNIEFTLAYGMTFSPNTEHAPYFNYPYEITENDTLLNTNIWKIWEDGYGGIDNIITENKQELQHLKMLAINCGYNDKYKWIPEGCFYYSELLRKQKIPFEMIWHSGGHSDSLGYQLKKSVFPSVAGALEH